MIIHDAERFISLIAPLLQANQKQSGVPAGLAIAQALIESAAGRSELGQKANNLFGIKWRDGCGYPAYLKLTKEWVGPPDTGHYIDVSAPFRHYPDIESSCKDHADFLRRWRYGPVFGQDSSKEAARLIRECGYATSPTYTDTLVKCIERYGLEQYNRGIPKMAKVFLSPSSQEWNRYAHDNSISEENICNKIADLVEQVLRAHNIDVLQNDPSGTPTDHTRKSNIYQPDLHVPIHTNAGGGHGCEVFVYNSLSTSSRSTLAGKKIYQYLSALTPSADRGLKTNQSFYEIKNTSAPCVYIEAAFHDNVIDAKWIVDNKQAIAEAIAHGIVEALNIPYRPFGL